MVDLVYPERINDSHKDFPLAALDLKTDAEMFSKYQLGLGKQDHKTSHIPKPLETLQVNTVMYMNIHF